MKKSKIKEIQARFLDEMAMRGAISASVRETNVYSANTTNKQKDVALRKWQTSIREIAKRYKNLRTRDDFISDVRRLQDMINCDQEIKQMFCKLDESGDIIANEYGIRIAQCQKSLSIYLKYLWCYGLIETPPVCPIDRVILNICKEYYKQNRNVADRQEKIELCSLNWTRIDDINKYTRLVEITEEVAGSQICTAEWELKKWNESVLASTTNSETINTKQNKKETMKKVSKTNEVSSSNRTNDDQIYIHKEETVFLNRRLPGPEKPVLFIIGKEEFDLTRTANLFNRDYCRINKGPYDAIMNYVQIAPGSRIPCSITDEGNRLVINVEVPVPHPSR